MQTNWHRARDWMQANLSDYDSAFDLAVDCAYCLDILEECEINGDRTFIPIWLTYLAENFLP